jgi:hypothetical protein
MYQAWINTAILILATVIIGMFVALLIHLTVVIIRSSDNWSFANLKNYFKHQ